MALTRRRTRRRVQQMSLAGYSLFLMNRMVTEPNRRMSQQMNVKSLPQNQPKYPREVDLLSLYPAEELDRVNSQRDTPRSEDYKSGRQLRHEMDHLFVCSRI